MYEDMNRSVPDISGYLERIGLRSFGRADLDGLDELIWRHHTHVPFEDLDSSYLRRPVALDIPALYDKVVTRRRGGYCYELNGLFTRLLLDLGYDARSVFCRIIRGRDFLPPCTHRGIVVALGGRLWYCDVGYGGPMPAGALPLEDGYSADVRGERFHVERWDEYWWTLSRTTSAGAREKLMQFNTFPQLPQEFLAANLKGATDPESIFVFRVLLNLRTERGSLSVTGDEFTCREGTESVTTKIADDAQFRAILAERFGIAGLDPAPVPFERLAH